MKLEYPIKWLIDWLIDLTFSQEQDNQTVVICTCVKPVYWPFVSSVIFMHFSEYSNKNCKYNLLYTYYVL